MREVLRTTAFFGVVGICVHTAWQFYSVEPAELVELLPPPLDGEAADCGPPAPGAQPSVVEMLYSEEKRAWIEYAAQRFALRCPNIQIRLRAIADLAAVDAILTGAAAPTVWAPSDSIVVTLLRERWQKRSPEPLFADDAAVSLVRSPLVYLMWDDRARVFTAIRERTAGETGPWSQLFCADIPAEPSVDTVVRADRIPGEWSAWYDETVLAPERRAAQARAAATAPPTKANRKRRAPEAPAAPESRGPGVEYAAPFPGLAEIAGWGRVKIGHASPTHSAAGLEAIHLMVHDHLVAPGGRGPVADSVDDLEENIFAAALDARRDEVRRWLARCEGGLDGDPLSARQLTEDMFHIGSARYDGVATYEHLVFPVLDRLAGNDDVMRNVTVVYPETTFVNQSPALVLAHASDESRAAARTWLTFLRSEAMQRRAIELGFRPGEPTVEIRDHRVDANPFLRHRRHGISFVDPLTEPPRLDGAHVDMLLELWREATGRT